jgi:hypothetical protein
MSTVASAASPAAIHAAPVARPRNRWISPIAVSEGATDQTTIAMSGIGQIGCVCTRLYDRQTSGPEVATVPETVAEMLQPVPSGAKRKARPTTIPSPATATAAMTPSRFTRATLPVATGIEISALMRSVFASRRIRKGCGVHGEDPP